MQSLDKNYDVVICGAGLAGLTLAKQMRMQLPDQRILIIDRMSRPLPEAAHKVGESTVHPGGTYLCKVIGLKDYLDNNHVEKYGLRYYFGNHKNVFSDRAEVGRASYDEAIFEHQVDRGILESDLRQIISDEGAELIEGAVLKDIEIGEGEEDHSIHFTTQDKENKTVKARWVIDATGRRQFIVRKLNLREEFPKNCSASWIRVKGRFDMSDLVPKQNEEWHNRVSTFHPHLSDFGRYNSTNHIMGLGYWIWVIPLVSGYTSIGVVTHNDHHEFSSHNTLDKTKEWLHKHDPTIAEHLENFEILDYKKIANYAHTASHIYSTDRWACTGESGVFSDPFQSPGTDTIAISNCYINELIKADLAGDFNQELVESVNKEMLDYSQTLTQMIQQSYSSFYDGTSGTLSVMWYLAWAMSFIVPNMRFRLYKDGYIAANGPIADEEYLHIQRINKLGLKVSEFIEQWAIAKKDIHVDDQFRWMAFWDFPFFGKFRSRMLSQDSPEWEGNLEMLSYFAAAIFLLAVEEVHPELYDGFDEDFVPNIWNISMNPSNWEKDGVFQGENELDFDKVHEIKRQLKEGFYQKELQKVMA